MKTNGATAVAELPGLEPAIGEPLDANAARDALTNNDIQPDAGDGETESTPAKGELPSGSPVPLAGQRDGEPNPAPSSSGEEEKKRGPGRPPGKGPSKRKLLTMGKGPLVDLYLAERAKVEAAEQRAESLAQDVTVRAAVSSDVVDESLRGIVGDVLDVAETAAQLAVGEQFAETVALDAKEKARIELLAARVAKLRMNARVLAFSPEIELGLCVLSIVGSKYIAYKLARKDAGGE